MYTIRRLTRQKINGIAIHHGTQVLSVDGRTALWQGQDGGRPVTVTLPVIDMQADGKLYVKTFDQFAAGRPVSAQQQVVMDAPEFGRRFQSILTDIRTYSLSERNCETTADILVEGKPVNRQFKAAVGVGLVALAIMIFAK